MENKKIITEELFKLLKLTREFEDLISLEYERTNFEEIVTAIFKNGYRKRANVTFDSGIALIQDTIKQIRL